MIVRPLTSDASSPAASSQRWRSRWWRVVQHAGALGFVLGYVLFVNSPALKSKLAMLDDYEILDFVSSDRLLSWSRVWHTFRADAFASTGRFLPVHYILRAAEMKLWASTRRHGTHADSCWRCSRGRRCTSR